MKAATEQKQETSCDQRELTPAGMLGIIHSFVFCGNDSFDVITARAFVRCTAWQGCCLNDSLSITPRWLSAGMDRRRGGGTRTLRPAGPAAVTCGDLWVIWAYSYATFWGVFQYYFSSWMSTSILRSGGSLGQPLPLLPFQRCTPLYGGHEFHFCNTRDLWRIKA